jgi:hypothetical protein
MLPAEVRRASFRNAQYSDVAGACPDGDHRFNVAIFSATDFSDYFRCPDSLHYL